MHLQRLLAIINEELPSRFAARLESRLRQEDAAGRLGTSAPKPRAPSVDAILRELPKHNNRLDQTASALGISETALRRALGDRLKPPKPMPPERDSYGRLVR